MIYRVMIFLQIELGFLVVGHTHEDVDQSFSCLARFLQKHDALTPAGTLYMDLLSLCVCVLIA